MKRIISGIIILGMLSGFAVVRAKEYDMNISSVVDPVEEIMLINGVVTSGPDEKISVVTSDEEGTVVFANEIWSGEQGKFKASINIEDFDDGKYTTVFRTKNTDDYEIEFELPVNNSKIIKIDAEITGNNFFLIKNNTVDEENAKVLLKTKNVSLLKGVISEEDYIVTGLPDGYSVKAYAISENTIELELTGSGKVDEQYDLGVILKSTLIASGKANTSSEVIEGIVIYPEEVSKTVNLDSYSFEAFMSDERNVNTSKSTFEVAVKIRKLAKDGILEQGVDYDYTLPTELSGIKCEISANKENGTIRIKFSGAVSNKLTKDSVISDFTIKSACVTGAEYDSELIVIKFKKASEKNNGSSGGASGMGYTGGGMQTVVIEPTVPKIEISFDDVKGHWAENEIHTLAGDGIINGIGGNDFAPERKITRAEFVTLIVRAFELTEGVYDESFSDVKKNDWFAGSVAKALSAGIISKDTAFRPDDPITREEMVKIIVGGWLTENERPEWINVSQFTDGASISDWASDYVDVAVTLGLVKGDNLNNFNPKNGTTRAEAATVIYRMLYMN